MCYFDKILVNFCDNEKEYILFNDIAQEGIITIRTALLKAIKNQLQIKLDLVDRGVGYWWNEMCHKCIENHEKEGERIVFEKYMVWSTIGTIGNET